MQGVLYLFIGGGIGTVGRYLLGLGAAKLMAGSYPIGTLLVNLLGSLVIGFLWNYFNSGDSSNQLKLLVMVGVLGGFTTFSSYAIECLNLYNSGNVGLAITHVLANNIGGILLALAGISLGQTVFR
ncbi:MAG: CrcB protein [Sphingobacteriales bacterium]|jgi:CrcB protein